MDILYIIGPKSVTNWLELRCSLRSIEKFGRNVGKVYVVGHCPKWLSSEVVEIPHQQPFGMTSDFIEKGINIASSIVYAVENSDISDEFLLSMDDHFYVRDVDFDKYPYYLKDYRKRECRALLPTREQDRKHTEPYTEYLRSTQEYLVEKGLPYYNLCPHRNMHCSRQLVEECKPFFKEIYERRIGVEHLCFMLNYLYSKNPFELIPVEDIKITSKEQKHKIDPEKTEIFSTSDFYPFTGLWFMLREMYPNQSKYEKKNCLTLL